MLVAYDTKRSVPKLLSFCSLVAKKSDVKMIVAKKKARILVGVGGLESCLLVVSDYQTGFFLRRLRMAMAPRHEDPAMRR